MRNWGCWTASQRTFCSKKRQSPLTSGNQAGCFVSEGVPSKLRLRVQCSLIDEMVRAARGLGATSLIGIVPEHSPRLARRTGIDCVAAGPVIETDDGDRSVCVNISLATKLH